MLLIQNNRDFFDGLHVYDLVISIVDLLFEGGAEGNPNG